MVDMESVMTKVKRNLLVGAGTFASTFVGNQLEGVVPGGDMGVAFGNIAIGTGLSVGSDIVFERSESIPNDVGEFVGYGIAGSGWAELADEIRVTQSSGRAVDVSVGADVRKTRTRQTGQNVSTTQRDQEVFLDSA